jgi:hypothetical protein
MAKEVTEDRSVLVVAMRMTDAEALEGYELDHGPIGPDDEIIWLVGIAPGVANASAE